MNCNIILIGMMGCGKSSVGQIVSKKLDMLFVDTDDMIEDSAKMAIPDIFEQYGESYFRALESKAAQKAAALSKTVIATGGGIILNPENIKALKTTGLVIYLSCRPEILYKRVKEDNSRPLISVLDANEKLDKLKGIFKQREHLYLKNCDIVIDTEMHNEEEIAEVICGDYCRYQRS